MKEKKRPVVPACHAGILGDNQTPVGSCIGYLVHPFKKKMDLSLFDHSYPLTRSSMEGQGNRFF